MQTKKGIDTSVGLINLHIFLKCLVRMSEQEFSLVNIFELPLNEFSYHTFSYKFCAFI